MRSASKAQQPMPFPADTMMLPMMRGNPLVDLQLPTNEPRILENGGSRKDSKAKNRSGVSPFLNAERIKAISLS